mmetsp:Transcript_19189/g.35061  ORF Transcript_19189/g.35061 Transcript_19189/m.35061 type:complete len:102 (-) Transcript_19189:1808-2113(-)
MSHRDFEKGGICYLACEELFEQFNNSRWYCYKGCDYASGRVNDPALRLEATEMCKRMTTEAMVTSEDLDTLDDLRVSSFMVPDRPSNIYRACLAGIRRQRF